MVNTTLKQQREGAKQRAMGVYQFYLARGFSSEEAQQMQVDHFNGKQVATHSVNDVEPGAALPE